jgi:hypothetical protein
VRPSNSFASRHTLSYSYLSFCLKATDKDLMKKGKVKWKALEKMLKKESMGMYGRKHGH